MNVFHKLRIAAQAALEWERKNYITLTPEQAWERGYDVEGDMLLLDENDHFPAVATASPEAPHLVEISGYCGPEYHTFTLNMNTGEIENV